MYLMLSYINDNVIKGMNQEYDIKCSFSRVLTKTEITLYFN